MSEPYYSQRARSVCVSLSAFFILICIRLSIFIFIFTTFVFIIWISLSEIKFSVIRCVMNSHCAKVIQCIRRFFNFVFLLSLSSQNLFLLEFLTDQFDTIPVYLRDC